MQYGVRSAQCAVRSTQCAVRSSRLLVFLFTVWFTGNTGTLYSQYITHYTSDASFVWEGRVNALLTNTHTAIRGTLQFETEGFSDSITKADAVSDSIGYRSYFLEPMHLANNGSRRTALGFRGYGKSGLRVIPIYDAQAGFDLKESRLLTSLAGGVSLGFNYRKAFSVTTNFASGIVTLPNYQDSLANHGGFVPGWGDRAYRLDSARYGFQHLSGNIIWRPTPVFNLQVGRDKHFWGDGHRSLFLGDHGPAFPYLKMQTTIWKLQYTSMFAWLQDWTNSTGSNDQFRSKFASFHYLSFNAAKWLNISVFEAVVWQGTDNNRARLFDPNYLNPLVFFRPVEYSLGSSDNAMLGIAGKIRFNKNNVLYGQIILDEFYLKEIRNWKDGWWANKQGVQIGYKCYNFAMVTNLFLQTEVNIVRPYTYAHGSPQQSYSNGPLPLAHPMGANFSEVIGVLAYYTKGFTVTGKLVGIRYGADVNDTMNYGQNVFQSYITRESEYGNKLWQGYATNVFLAQFTASYVFNTKFPLRVQLTALARSERNAARTLKSSFVMAGLSLPLFRAQADY